MRPATDVYMPIGLCSAAKGRLLIQPNGNAFVIDQNLSFTNAQCFTSLDGVSFAPSASGFAPLSLLNGWFGAPFGTSNASASIIRNVVYLKGAIGSGLSTVTFTLPAILRPEASVYVPVDLCNANKGRLLIQSNGTVIVQALTAFSEAQCFTSLDGVSYVVPEPTALPALLAGLLLLIWMRESRTKRARAGATGRGLRATV